METIEELKKWVKSLTAAEKRFIKILGKTRAGAGGSQQMDMFDWLSQPDETAMPLPETTFFRNLSTVSIRLKDLILDSLRILNKDSDLDARLRSALDDIATLTQKQLFPAALRLIKRAKKLAADNCCYTFSLQYLECEQKITQHSKDSDRWDKLQTLQDEETSILQKRAELQDLKHRHERILIRAKQLFIPRNAQELQEIQALTQSETITRISQEGAYLERAIAINILGMKDLFERHPLHALHRYAPLLREWQAHPEWQVQHGALLVAIYNCYQMACFYAPMQWEDILHYLALLPDFEALTPEMKAEFQRKIYNSQFSVALNTGNFDMVNTLIPEIDHWLQHLQPPPADSSLLPFLHNFAIAEFLQGNFPAAKKFITRILQLPNRKARQDIREFAILLQAVLHYETDDSSLNEYLTRAGRRHFTKHAKGMAFELAVFEHLDLALRTDSPTRIHESLMQLVQTLDDLGRQVQGNVPLLGLMEMRLWAGSRLEERALKEVFLEAVEENLEALGTAKSLKVSKS